MRKKKYLISGLTIFFLLVIFLIIKATKNKDIDISKLTDEQIIDLLKTNNIKNLKPEQMLLLEERLSKMPYEKIEIYFGNLPEKLKNRFQKNFELIYEVKLDKKIEEFFNSPEEKQEKILDEEINRIEKAEEKGLILPEYAEFYEDGTLTTERRGFPSRRFFGRSSNPNAMLQRARDRLSMTTPTQRARRQEFIKRLNERRKNRPFRR